MHGGGLIGSGIPIDPRVILHFEKHFPENGDQLPQQLVVDIGVQFHMKGHILVDHGITEGGDRFHAGDDVAQPLQLRIRGMVAGCLKK